MRYRRVTFNGGPLDGEVLCIPHDMEFARLGHRKNQGNVRYDYERAGNRMLFMGAVKTDDPIPEKFNGMQRVYGKLQDGEGGQPDVLRTRPEGE